MTTCEMIRIISEDGHESPPCGKPRRRDTCCDDCYEAFITREEFTRAEMEREYPLLDQTERLREFALRLRSVDPRDNTAFADIVRNGMAVLGVSDRELADEFEAAVSTINRWKRGVASPHPLMRPSVYRWFREQLARRL